MKSRQAVCLAAVLWWGAAAGEAQTVVGVSQGGTGAKSAPEARTKLGAAAAVHTHTLGEVQGVTGKSGTGTELLSFGGGGKDASTCAMFDSSGNLVSTGAGCLNAPTGATFVQNFTNATSVVINHGLGTKNVVTACYDAEDRLVGVHSARVPTVNQTVVEFAEAQSGRCVVQGAGGVEISGAVTSVFGRQGLVTAEAGDYGFAQISGVAGLAQGGTNQTIWTAGRCVQVAADGSRLESAAEACGAGLGEATAVSNTGAGAQVLKTGTNVAGRTLVGGENVTITQETDTITIAAPGAGGGGVETADGLLGDGSVSDPVRVNPALVPSYFTESATVNDWGTIGAAACVEQTFPFAGALTGDAVIARWPAALPSGLTGLMRVPSIDTMAVRLCNATGAGVAVANGFQFGATILRSF
jgi:hypothetical protein